MGKSKTDSQQQVFDWKEESKLDGITFDRALDRIFNGERLSDAASKLKIAVEALTARFRRVVLKQPERYLPYRRLSRRKQKFTKQEKKVIEIHRKRGIPTEHTARVLQREPREIRPDYKGQITTDRFRQVAPRVDVLLAYRFLFYCSRVRLISDQAYDEAKAEEMEYGGGMDVLSKPASGKPVDYPAHIRSLAFYMHYKSMEKTGDWDANKLPLEFTKGKGREAYEDSIADSDPRAHDPSIEEDYE